MEVRSYLEWGWPVTVCGRRVLLTIGGGLTAIVLSELHTCREIDSVGAVQTVLRAAVAPRVAP
jgi:hypothetical protein